MPIHNKNYQPGRHHLFRKKLTIHGSAAAERGTSSGGCGGDGNFMGEDIPLTSVNKTTYGGTRTSSDNEMEDTADCSSPVHLLHRHREVAKSADTKRIKW